MQKWEYKIICHGDRGAAESKLNEAASEGWEFLTATAAAPDAEIVVHTIYLRRPIPGEPREIWAA